MHEPEHWGHVYLLIQKIKSKPEPNNALFVQDLYNVYLEQIFKN